VKLGLKLRRLQFCQGGRLTRRVSPEDRRGLVDDLLDQVARQDLPEGRDHGGVEGVLPESLAVLARAVLAIVPAEVVHALRLPADRVHRPPAASAPNEPAEEVRGLEPGLRTASLGPRVRGDGPGYPRVDPLPEILGDDPKLGGLDDRPSARVGVALLGGARVVLPLGPPVDDLAAVEGPVCDLPNRGHRPAPPRAGDPLGVQRNGDPAEPLAGRERLEDPDDDAGLLGVDFAANVIALADVAVPVDPAARTVAALGLPEQGVAHPRSGLLALDLGGERCQGEHHLIEGRRDRERLPVEVAIDRHAGLSELLHRVGRLDLFAPEPRRLRQDQDVERGTRFQCRHESKESGPLLELGAGDPVIDVDVGRVDGPALPLCVRGRVLDLAGRGLRLVGDVLLE
jgi:hypothetical protein